jgi:hypothetical protein
MATAWRKVFRVLVLTLFFFLPQSRKVALERRLRGRDDQKQLNSADYVIVSYGKSGRTWLRVMLSRFYQVRCGIPERVLLSADNFHRRDAAVPRVFFTHDNYLKDHTGNRDDKRDYYAKKVVLLVRNPADTAVSQFFQWKYRMRTGKKSLNDYPDHGSDISLFDFVAKHEAGLKKIIDFMNLWAEEKPRIKDLLVVRYEDMRARPEETLAGIVAFLGTPGTPEEVQQAVEYASFENMRRLEERRVFWLAGGRMVPKDRANPNTYKVRRAKVGGYKDYFEDEEVAEIDAMVRARLSPVFGYDEASGAQAANA